jgi:hypothetical protein
MRQAAELEDREEKNVAMENRLSPMRELLGEMLLEAGQPGLAQREFVASLQLCRIDTDRSSARRARPSHSSMKKMHACTTSGCWH